VKRWNRRKRSETQEPDPKRTPNRGSMVSQAISVTPVTRRERAWHSWDKRSFLSAWRLVQSSQAADDERDAKDHEHDADNACCEALERVFGIDFAPNNPSVYEGSREQACPLTPEPDHRLWAQGTSHTHGEDNRTEKHE
jgi:hypothetical protein